MVSFKEGQNWIRACCETSPRLQGEATILVRQEMNDPALLCGGGSGDGMGVLRDGRDNGLTGLGP